LNESRRSSQNICNSTFRISSLEEVSTSVSEDVKAFGHLPRIVTYANNLPEIVQNFIDECTANGIEATEKNRSVIYRSRSLINDITGIPEVPVGSSPWNSHDNYTKDFAKGKFLYDNGDFKGGFRAIEKAIIKQIRGLSFCSEETVDEEVNQIGFVKFKSQVFEFVNKVLPLTNVTLGSWVDAANNALKHSGISFQLSISNAGKVYTFQQIFLSENEKVTPRNFRLGTVHSVKGETFDATLLILKTKGVGKAYKTILNQDISIKDSEELRIAYVGLTRPRKILVLAVPDEPNKEAWTKKVCPS
jgi:DNA helicase II / ATP-dependent DNA helicase PcrA